MDDPNKFPFELPKGDESPAKNPPMASPSIPSRPAPTPPPVRPATPPASPKPEVKIATGQVVPGAKPEFFSPETFEASPIPAGVKSDSSLVKNIILVVVSVIFVGGIGALSYFVVFPLLFPPKGSVTPPPVVAVPVTHKSYLVKSPAAEVDLKLADHKYLTIATALQSEGFNQLSDGQVKEVKISESGTQMPFSTFLSAVSPVASALADGGYFEKDFTAILYYDANGVWPVYVAKLKAGANAVDLLSIMKSIEGVLDLGSLYLAPPGSFADFKDGQVSGRATRYAVGTQSGASFNYGLLGDYFVLATSYNGLKATAPLLGL